MSKKLPYIILLINVLTFLPSCMKEPDLQPNTNMGNFKALWEIIDKRYCYLDYKKINWDSVHTVYALGVDTVKSKYELFDLLGKMLSELKDGHVNLYSSFDRSRYWKWYTDYPSNFSIELLTKQGYLGTNYRISGGMRYNQIANGRVGYIYYGSFSDDFSDSNIRLIFEQFSACEGLIIDVRDNGGGLVSNSSKLSSYFFNEKTLTGYMSHKTGDGHSDFSAPVPSYTQPHPNIRWEKPVIVLTNRMSYSATNDFVCNMQYAPRSIIIGDQTGGGGGMPLSSELPNGWMVRFSASPRFDASMNHVEWGIAPDIKVNMNQEDVAKGRDTIIEMAVKEILK